jgi:hypothetical protein
MEQAALRLCRQGITTSTRRVAPDHHAGRTPLRSSLLTKVMIGTSRSSSSIAIRPERARSPRALTSPATWIAPLKETLSIGPPD